MSDSRLDCEVSFVNPSIQDCDDDGSEEEEGSIAGTPRTPHRCMSVTCHCDVLDETKDLLSTSRSVSTPQSLPHSPSSDSVSSSGTHCHADSSVAKFDNKARRKLIIASVFCLVFMTGEVAGGFLAHSLALISDGAHLLTDFASFMISLLALYLGRRRSTKKLSFGWYRAEILGALVSILLLWVLTGILCYSAVLRIVDDNYNIDATIMLITAGCGVLFNVVLGVTLHQHGHSHGGLSHGHSHGKQKSSANEVGYSPLRNDEHNEHLPIQDTSGKNMYGSMSEANMEAASHNHGHKHKKENNINVKAAFVHVLGDLLQSIGVLIAAFIIYFKPEWKIADPICTFLFSVFVIVTTVTIMRDILVVLMEGTPRSLNFGEVRDAFFTVKGIKDIHNLRMWSLTMDKTALSVHIAVDKDADPLKVIKLASYLIQKKFDISETTMQIEEFTTDMMECTQCQHLKD